jgi:hypothetical protein
MRQPLRPHECRDIEEILKRRANDVASFCDDFGIDRKKLPGSVEMALSREIQRLRELQSRVSQQNKLLDFETPDA